MQLYLYCQVSRVHSSSNSLSSYPKLGLLQCRQLSGQADLKGLGQEGAGQMCGAHAMTWLMPPALSLPHTCLTGSSCAPSPSPRRSPPRSPHPSPCRAASPARASPSLSLCSRREDRHLKGSNRLTSAGGSQKRAPRPRFQGEGARQLTVCSHSLCRPSQGAS